MTTIGPQRGSYRDPLRNGADMALTNAERQARHRERVKEKLRNAVPAEPLRNDADAREEGIQSIEDLLIDAYFGTASTWFEFLGGHDDSPSSVANKRRAIDAFLAEQVGFTDLVFMIREQAWARLNEHYGSPEEALGEMSWRRHAAEIKPLRNA